MELKETRHHEVSPPVALVRFREGLYATIRRGISLAGGLVRAHSPVLIKPNICTIDDETGFSVTDIEVVRTVIRLLLEADSTTSVRVVESDSQSKFAVEAFHKFGYTQMFNEFQMNGYDVDLIDLSRQPLIKVELDGEYFRELELHEILTEPHLLVSVAVAKTHCLTSITGAVKNLFGLLPRKDKSFYHSQIDDVIVDLVQFIRPQLSIVDARVGIEGWNGPRIERIGAFIVGRDPVGVDAVLSRLLGFDPQQSSHLVRCSERGLGTLTPALVGNPLDALSIRLSTSE
ncbi:MAG: hypothetical protein DRP09_14115 [Candidatus Thorarchaeota archaeon]|nr:MAG: hypothetical protein DRP09_14115 [Candidatus Thorarchaeota archaeon]